MVASTPLNGSSSSSSSASWATARASEHALLLAARQHAEAVAGAVGEADLVERRRGRGAVGPARGGGASRRRGSGP